LGGLTGAGLGRDPEAGSVEEPEDEVYDRDIFEEYRYDGLGRRIMVRNTRQGPKN
jgi:hypothetical protein